MEPNNYNNLKFIKTPLQSENSPKLMNSPDNSFFKRRAVKERKNLVLRTRFQTLIKQTGMTNSQFYKKAGISRQYYYFLSWGLWEVPIDTKLKISKILGVDSALIWDSSNSPIQKGENLPKNSSFAPSESVGLHCLKDGDKKSYLSWIYQKTQIKTGTIVKGSQIRNKRPIRQTSEGNKASYPLISKEIRKCKGKPLGGLKNGKN